MIHTDFSKETMKLVKERFAGLSYLVEQEIERLLATGKIDLDEHHRGLLIGVAIENIAEKWLLPLDTRDRRTYRLWKAL